MEGKIKTLVEEFVVPLRFGAYNLSFDRGTFEELLHQLAQTREQQQSLITKYENGESLTDDETALLKAIAQVRNVAEVIQRTDPDVFVLAEFNNDGTATNDQGLVDFQSNYLSYAQHADVSPVSYQYTKNIPTNTGLQSGHDLNRDGVPGGPGDAWGFGFYHGQYAFAVFSKLPFDEANYRTFQGFKWKDMEGEKNIEIACDGVLPPPPGGMACGDPWYTEEAWNVMPLSSKNHIDLPILLQAGGKQLSIHFMVSHPAPPISNNPANHNTEKNRAEVKFWHDYIASKGYFYDDEGKKEGGLPVGAYFVIAGDLNADPDYGDGDRQVIANLLADPLVNAEATTGGLRPVSNGAPEYVASDDCYVACERTDSNEAVTSTSALRIDYVIPSANLKVIRSGVFWPASGEEGRHLVYDEILGTSKEVSSDHRMVWMDLVPLPVQPE